MPPAETLPVLRVVILGTDALLSARPATPIQLARACMQLGFDLVAPISWGEEWLAMGIMESVRDSAATATVISHCPFVAEALRLGGRAGAHCWFAVTPPAATARYIRGAFEPRAVHLTYAGRCPGATAPDIDACMLPEVLFNRLAEARLVPAEQPPYFEELLPPDRARYASLPGGVPEPSLLFAMTGQLFREGAPATLSAMLPSETSPTPVVIDLEAAVGCICAQDRFAASQLEPPRATSPVIDTAIKVDLTDDRVDRLGDRIPVPSDVEVRPTPNPFLRDVDPRGDRALEPEVRTERQVERSASREAPAVTYRATEGASEPPVQRFANPPLTTAVEPWMPKPRAARFLSGTSSAPSSRHDEVSTPEGTEVTIAFVPVARAPETGDLGLPAGADQGDTEAIRDVAKEQGSSLVDVLAPPLPVQPPVTDDVVTAPAKAPPLPDRAAGGTPTQHPSLREAPGDLARAERRAFVQKRTRALIVMAVALALIGVAYATTRYVSPASPDPAMPLEDTVPPRLPALEVRHPASDTSAPHADSFALDSSRHFAAPIRRDTAPRPS